MKTTQRQNDVRHVAEHSADSPRPYFGAEPPYPPRPAGRGSGFTWQSERGELFVRFPPVYSDQAVARLHFALLAADSPDLPLPDGVELAGAET